jgi:hypothetical protein
MRVLRLLRRARRRVILNGLIEEGTNALSGALAAFILLLILGAQILDWRVALLLPIGAAGVGLYCLIRRLPSAYAIAQAIDRRLALADTLSTAVFFSGQSRHYAALDMRGLQLEQAERVAASVDAHSAIPFTMPRSTYALAVLALVASSLFGLRYGLQRALDLRLPITTILAQNLGLAGPSREAKAFKKGAKSELFSDQNAGGSPRDEDQVAPGDMDSASDQMMLSDKGQPDPADAAESEQAQNDPNANGKQQSGNSKQDQAGDMEQPPGDMEGSEGQKGTQKSGGGQADGSRDSEDGQGGGSSLLSKLQNAVQNLLSKVAPQSGGSQQASNGQNGKAGQSGGAKQQGGDKQQAGAQQPDGQGGDPGDQADSEQDDESTGAGSSGEQPSSKMAGSGIGSQNGDKSVKQAEQLAAMGKISEIIGKRAANVTGEAMVEVQTTKQQVRTPYAQRNAEHTEGGAEISRDEVPAALQAYIEQYFEQIHKQDKTPAQKSK